jgi:hypothetical protein
MSILKTNQVQSTAGKTILNATGSILQVKSVYDNTLYTFSSGSPNQSTYYPVSGLQLTIIPSSLTSKIVIIGSVACGQAPDAYNCFIRLYRNGTTPLAIGNGVNYLAGCTAGLRTMNGTGYVQVELQTFSFTDSPATTSAVTYQVYCCNSGGGTYVSTINRPSTTQNDGWVQNVGSNLMVMEISG